MDLEFLHVAWDDTRLGVLQYPPHGFAVPALITSSFRGPQGTTFRRATCDHPLPMLSKLRFQLIKSLNSSSSFLLTPRDVSVSLSCIIWSATLLASPQICFAFS